VIKGLFYGNYRPVNACAVATGCSQQDLLTSGILDVSHPSMISASLVDCGG
jgi:hypothetical protein